MTTTLTADHELSTATTSSLCIHVRFITDRCVAARVDAREQPEWPPHPGRLFLALAATYFETDGSVEDKLAEQAALDWLAGLTAPRIRAVDVAERSDVVCYVPVNDSPLPTTSMLQSAPGMPRSRQSRTFPTVIPQRATDADRLSADITYEWRELSAVEVHRPSLERLCSNLIRMGHSSSLVMVWIDTEPSNDSAPHWEPCDTSNEIACRVPAVGELERLKQAGRVEEIELFAALKQEIESTKGPAQKAAKERFTAAFGEPYKASLRPPAPTPATLNVWQGYRRTGDSDPFRQRPVENDYFDRELIILAKDDGPVLNLERTLNLTAALRKALMSANRSSKLPAWLSGHDADGEPTVDPHAAFLPLGFVGAPYADGHIMGLAIALPKGLSPRERARWLGPLLVNQDSGDLEAAKLKLWARDLPDWSLRLEQRPSPPRTLLNDTWTRPATTWASVTPVVLDRFPKASRADDRAAWQAEVTAIIQQSCERSGLPRPVEVDVDSTAWHAGVPRAWAKTRPLRGGAPGEVAGWGDGFPSLAAKASRPPRPQVHVWLRFEQPVCGPVLLGAGRFAGYGLCLPMRSPQ